MALRLLSLRLIFLITLIFAESTPADPSLLSEDVVVSLEQPAYSFSSTKDIELELHKLKSKISSLEIRIEEKRVEFDTKDDSIKKLEEVIEEKSDTLASLQNSLQDKGSLDVKKSVDEVNTRADELEKQIINLKKEIQVQEKKKENLEARANAAEKKIEGLNVKLENLRRINEEQKVKIRKTQQALQVAEEDMLKAKLEASSIAKQLNEAHQVWLPPWLSAHLVHFQSVFVAQWNEHGIPALHFTIEKEAKTFMTPFLDQVSRISKPHLDKASLYLKPYSKKMVRYQKKITKNIRKYHSQVRAQLHVTLNSYELTKPLATERLVWFMATFVMSLPMIAVFGMFQPKEPKKRHRTTKTGPTRRKVRRSNLDK